MQDALNCGVNLWLAWGLEERNGGGPGDPSILSKLDVMSRRHDNGKLTVKYLGNNIRKCSYGMVAKLSWEVLISVHIVVIADGQSRTRFRSW